MFNYNLFIQRLSKRNLATQSFIKNEIAQRLLKRLDFINLSPRSILIDGYCDSDYLQMLKSRFTNSDIALYRNDKQCYDLIISNSIIHITDNIADKLDDYYELLNDDGILLFSSFGDKSFTSLNQAFTSIDNYPHTNTMIDLLTWGNTLQNSRYKVPAIESDLITFTYEKVETLFADIRALNEPLADTKSPDYLMGKNKWEIMLEVLKNNLQLEIEALYGYAERRAEQDVVKRENPNRISLDELKQQIADFKNLNNT